ncbi:transportin MOS14 [Vigna unguiculata]|uniref:Armadillo-type fold n=2 Tax=Vigna unguiculata TaxID=3917 RepID=A0A4D6KWE2_VIGUN|nr:transportin MOS14 [Vigna unguiculata]QCD80913.1 Armadillo-type fold [Vigna unguiculata]
MDLQNTVKEALNALYHHPDDAVRMQADRYLQDFQRTLDAWQVADNLLHDPSSNLETLIFCSQTLRSKVQRDFEELPSTAFRPLRDSLNTLLKKFHKGPPKVRTQISIAVAALAVHVPAEDWGDGGIVKWLRDEMDSHPEYIPGFLELLTVLPEEVLNYKIAARPERRRQFEKELTSQMEVALNILTACLTISELKEQVLEAFASWLRLKHGIPGSVLSSHPLVLTALSSLNSELLSEASVNVISELIHYTAAGNSDGVSANMPLIQVIVPQVMNLKAQLSDSTKDEEDVKAIARLFADMGDSYVELIATGSDESMLIVHALLEVASHPEYDIASMTFNFWHNLQLNLTKRESYISYGNEACIEAERNRRLQVFRPAYESLVSLVIFRVQYPEDYQDLSYEDLKEFKQTKYAVADVLTDASSVLGGDATLKILYVKLLQAVSGHGNDEHKEWRPAEAALFCIRAISNYVSVVEAEVMPQIMALLPKLPHQPQLLQTVCLTIGAYSKWLDSASCGLSVLPSVLDILMNGMGTSEDCAAAAALAFRHICDDCRKKLCGCLEGLFHIYNKTVNGEDSFKVPAEDSLHLVEALSMVVTELPPDDAKRALEALCIPVITPLQEAIALGPESLSKRPSRQLTVHIDRFAYIFRYVNHPQVVADAIQRLWPIFKAIFDLRAWDMRTMESLCRACKYAVRTSGRFMGLTIGAMLEEIQSLYRQHHQPCFLYLSSEVIKIFGSDPSCADYLKSLIEALFQHTTRLLTNIQEFTARPDIADDCFLLASRCIRYCPQLFIPSSVFPSLVDCSMIGITVQHREASNSILHFLADIFDLANSSVGEQFIPIRDGVIIPRGASITRILVASLTGALPKSRVDVVSYTLLALTRSYGMQALEWAKKSVLLIPSTAVTDVERSRFLKALSDAASGGDTNGLTVPVEELSDVCRRNRSVQEIVQEALRPLELNMVNVS